MTVITRFAPSPTGYLHIGGARTALFNWLFARHYGGKFLLRIEDTDRERSTDDAIEAIFEGLKWLGLDWDSEPTFQFSRAARHVEVAKELIEKGKAYYCFCTPEELEEMRSKAAAEGRSHSYDGRWRDRDPKDAPAGIKPVIRLKMPQAGETVIRDTVQGTVTVQNAQLEDMILVRSDETPTYMLAVVVDDHDMGITHIIRGDDHLTNAFKQKQIYESMGWKIPSFTHIPLIHGPDGAKLSKRHGALGAEAYRDMGFLPEAMRNYLVRLSWAHGDDEIFNTQQAIEWFDGSHIGKSAARFDLVKLTSINAHYMQQANDTHLLRLLEEQHIKLTANQADRVLKGMPALKQRAKTLVELWENAQIYIWDTPITYTEKAKTFLKDNTLLSKLLEGMLSVTEWSESSLHDWAKQFAESTGMKLGDVAQPIRAALTGSTISPSVFEIAVIIGKELTKNRFQQAMNLTE